MFKYFNPISYFRFILKKRILRQFKKAGKNIIFDPLSTIHNPQYISVGTNVFIGERAHISAEVSIGNNVLFGPNPMIIGGNHYFGVKGKSVIFLHPRERENSRPIFIEDEVWCGARVIILGGVRIGIGAVIGAGSVVSKSIPPFTICVGNYCKPIKKIFNDNDLEAHLLGLKYSETIAKDVVDRRRMELQDWGLFDLGEINQTALYWETKNI